MTHITDGYLTNDELKAFDIKHKFKLMFVRKTKSAELSIKTVSGTLCASSVISSITLLIDEPEKGYVELVRIGAGGDKSAFKPGQDGWSITRMSWALDLEIGRVYWPGIADKLMSDLVVELILR